MPIFLEGIRVAFFRGIGPEAQSLGPFKGFNFFVGPNNAGKSTVLDAIHRHFGAGKPPSFQTLDAHSGKGIGQIVFQIGLTKQSFEQPILQRLESANVGAPRAQLLELARRVCSRLADASGMVWFGQKISNDAVRSAIGDGEWRMLFQPLTGNTGGHVEIWITRVLSAMFEISDPPRTPQSRFIPTNRWIGDASEEFSDYSGKGLINLLAQLQSPDHDKPHEAALFGRINEFVQTVTGRPDANIRIPHDRRHVLVNMDNKELPLSNLGTGVHEVVMIASYCTQSENQIVCIEEPENHLHPLLQRKLIAYLKANTSNQYFIATHSAAFIDTPGAAIFHVTNDGVQTRITESVLRKERFAICNDLGVRASDLVQSNFVIWVEGPSDRLYLREWIESANPDLEEGIHYSIMFYGGRLLSHLSADDDEVTEFIRLRSLNQNLCVIMDSDKESAEDDINDTKKRICDELTDDYGMAWVTQGREIENYLPPVKLEETIEAIYSAKYHAPGPRGDYKHALHFHQKTDSGARSSKLYTDVDKVKVAHELSKRGLDTDILDLKDRLAELVARIERANGLSRGQPE